MADDKPECVHTCKASECTPLTEESPQWFDSHMPCWICTSDKHEQRHDLMWHEESEMFFHRLCLLERGREQALIIADKIDSSFKDCVDLVTAGRLLRAHRRWIAR